MIEKIKAAFFTSPGPNSFKESFSLYLKGVMMGTADIIPGVSGGTIALISGIYDDLIDSIKSFNLAAVKSLLKGRFNEALAQTHLRFLLVLLAGILTALITLAKLMHWLLTHHPVPTWSVFFGLILASSLILGQKITDWFGKGGVAFIAGVVFGFVVVGLIPVTTPEAGWFIVLCGMIAICAMILPGISGSFLLLILGKYQFITAALRSPTEPGSLVIIGLFLLGAAMGITGFSRVLSWVLHRWHMVTLAFLTGLMTGSLRKIWPWKETIDSVTIRGKLHILEEANILPQLDQGLAIALVVMAVAFTLTVVLERRMT